MGVVLKLSCQHFVVEVRVEASVQEALCFVAFPAHRFIELVTVMSDCAHSFKWLANQVGYYTVVAMGCKQILNLQDKGIISDISR